MAFTAPYHRLLQRLGSRLSERDAQRVALVAAVLSHVEGEPATPVSLARGMGTPKGEAQLPVVSDSRFRHLLRNEEPEDLFRELVRVIRQLDRRASVDPLVRDLLRWDEATRMRWARDYYEAAAVAATKKS